MDQSDDGQNEFRDAKNEYQELFIRFISQVSGYTQNENIYVYKKIKPSIFVTLYTKIYQKQNYYY